ARSDHAAGRIHRRGATPAPGGLNGSVRAHRRFDVRRTRGLRRGELPESDRDAVKDGLTDYRFDVPVVRPIVDRDAGVGSGRGLMNADRLMPVTVRQADDAAAHLRAQLDGYRSGVDAALEPRDGAVRNPARRRVVGMNVEQAPRAPSNEGGQVVQ